MKTTRREFLKRSAAAGAFVSAPMIWTSKSAHGRNLNGKPTVAAIGVGGSRGRFNQGGNIARKAAKYGEMIACCDVDDRHTAEFNADFDNKLNLYSDYRVLFEKEKPDVVTIGTLEIAVFNVGGDLYALDNRCTHTGGPLVLGQVSDGAVTCPWHGTRFNLQNGQAACGPADSPVRTFPVRRVDGEIVIEIAEQPN